MPGLSLHKVAWLLGCLLAWLLGCLTGGWSVVAWLVGGWLVAGWLVFAWLLGSWLLGCLVAWLVVGRWLLGWLVGGCPVCYVVEAARSAAEDHTSLHTAFSSLAFSSYSVDISLFTKNACAFRSRANPGLHCLLYTSPSPRDKRQSRMPSSA